MNDSDYTYHSYEAYRKPEKFRFLKRIFRQQPQINIALFVLTLVTTFYVGGLSYSISIVSILLAHEMGHYLMCRKYGINATLPFFIPIPFAPFGTMGALIRIKSPIPNRRALFDVGVAGPLAGLMITIPVLLVGLSYSEFIPKTETQGFGLSLGESFLFRQLVELILGSEPEGYDTLMHPMAYAGWAGLFVTALNLLPVGQLDGGHVLYALFGKKSKNFFMLFLAIFMVIAVFFYHGWTLLILLLIFFGFKHPPPLNDYVPLDRKRKLLGYITLIIFFISFVPVPFYFN